MRDRFFRRIGHTATFSGISKRKRGQERRGCPAPYIGRDRLGDASPDFQKPQVGGRLLDYLPMVRIIPERNRVRASCRDRTDDLPLTRRPLWPSELRRRNVRSTSTAEHSRCPESLANRPRACHTELSQSRLGMWNISTAVTEYTSHEARAWCTRVSSCRFRGPAIAGWVTVSSWQPRRCRRHSR